MMSNLLQPVVLEVIKRKSLQPHRLQLIQAVHESSREHGLSGESFSTQNTVLASVPAAASALISHAAEGQPMKGVLRNIVRGALASTQVILAALPNESTLKTIESELLTIPSSGNIDSSDAERAGKAIKAELPKLPGIVISMAEQYWRRDAPQVQGTGGDPRFIAHNIVAVRASTGATASSLDLDLLRILRNPQTAVDWLTLLVPPEKSYNIVVAVYGAKRLNSIKNFLPSAEQIGRPSAHDGPYPSDKHLLRYCQDELQRNPSCFLRIAVKAPDAESAATAGLRMISETLDQYVAGQRLADLRVSDRVLVYKPEEPRPVTLRMSGPSVNGAYPLSSAWPQFMRESLRSSHIASASSSPTTKIALAWAALEAAGIHSTATGVLAGAMTLQTMRHQIAEAHHRLRSETLASYEATCQQRKLVASALAANEVNLSRVKDIPLARSSVTELVKKCQEQLRELERELEVEEYRHVLLGETEAFLPVDEKGYPLDLNRWADLLSVDVEQTCDVELRSARGALDKLTNGVPGLAALEGSNWSSRLQSPVEFEQWVTQTCTNYESALNRMFYVRNMAMHKGVFAMDGEDALARAAVKMVDLMQEFLGNWYRICEEESLLEEAEMRPIQIVTRISQRLDAVIQQVRQSDVERINFRHLTSPTSNSVDR